MAPKQPPKTTDKRGPKRKKPKGTPRQNAREGTRQDPERDEQIWRLFALAWSYRQISDQLGINISTVSRVLQKNPERRATIERAARQERAKRWEQLENGSLSHTLDWLNALGSTLKTAKGKTKARFSERDTYIHAIAPRIINSLAGLGDKATKQALLLSGGATERIGFQTGVTSPTDPADWSDEEIVIRAVRVGMESKLPPELAELMARMKRLGQLDEAPGEAEDQ